MISEPFIVAEPPPWRGLWWSGSSGGRPVTISDLAARLLEAFFLPGDTLVWAVLTHTPRLAQFLELGPQHYGGALSGFVSVVAWLLLLLVGGVLYNAFREADRALTDWIRNTYAAVLVCLRRMRTRLTARRGQRARGRAGRSALVVEEVALDARALRVLDMHAQLAPGYALATSEVAAALGVPAQQAQRVIGKLVKLRLLASTIGGLEGEDAYTITRSGRGLLALQRLDAPG